MVVSEVGCSFNLRAYILVTDMDTKQMIAPFFTVVMYILKEVRVCHSLGERFGRDLGIVRTDTGPSFKGICFGESGDKAITRVR